MNSTHQTILVISVAIGALVGALTGAASSTLVTGALQGSRILTPVVTGEALAPEEVDRQIVELIEDESATIAVVERVTPAVVSVLVKIPVSAYEESFFLDPFDPFYFGEEPRPAPEEPEELIEVGGGTGFFVSTDGYIVTNRHVVNDPEATYSVLTNDGVELPARVVATDPYLDLAILDVEGDGYPTVTFGDSSQLRIGQTVIAVGNTLAEFRNTVTKGVVSGMDRRVIAGDAFGEEVIEHAIQTDAAINPGNSGGPLINLLGEVVGVNTAVSFEGQSLGFAIPINDIKKAVSDVEQFGEIRRPWLGVRYVALTEAMAEEEGIPVSDGALIIEGEYGEGAIVEGSPAEAAGLQAGDVIVSVNGLLLTSDNSLGPIISQYYPGDTVTLRVVRGEEQFDVDVTLEQFVPTF